MNDWKSIGVITPGKDLAESFTYFRGYAGSLQDSGKHTTQAPRHLQQGAYRYLLLLTKFNTGISFGDQPNNSIRKLAATCPWWQRIHCVELHSVENKTSRPKLYSDFNSRVRRSESMETFVVF